MTKVYVFLTCYNRHVFQHSCLNIDILIVGNIVGQRQHFKYIVLIFLKFMYIHNSKNDLKMVGLHL